MFLVYFQLLSFSCLLSHSFAVMLSFIRRCGLTAIMAVSVVAGPVAVRTTDLVAIRSTDLDLYSNLDARFIPSIALGSYSLATSNIQKELLNM